MKIVIVFLTLCVGFVYGTTLSIDKVLYDDKINYYKRLINMNKMYKDRLEKRPSKNLEQLVRDTAHYTAKYTKELESFKSNYKKNPQKVVKELYTKKKKDLQWYLNYYKKYANHQGMTGVRYRSKEKELKKLEEGYTKYLASLEKSDSTQDNSLGNLIKKGTIKPVDVKNKKVVSLLDITGKSQKNNESKLQPVQLKASNLNTTTTLQNVNVGEKAKANVGGVSIGSEENK